MVKVGIAVRARRNLEDYLREFVYGGIDGSVTTFAVVAGATGAHFVPKVILVLGFANLVADGFSMSVGSYLSTKSEHEVMHKRGIVHQSEPSPAINGLATFVAFVLVGLVPLLVYTANLVFGLQIRHPFLTTSVMTGLAFVGIGFLKSRVAATPMVRAILETVILGTIAASFAYGVGDVLARAVTG